LATGLRPTRPMKRILPGLSDLVVDVGAPGKRDEEAVTDVIHERGADWTFARRLSLRAYGRPAE
jgi:hypothetical protein